MSPKHDPLRVTARQEYKDIASRIENDIRQLNASLTAFAATNDQLESNRFIQVSREFQTWIDSQQNNSKMVIRVPIHYERDSADVMEGVKLALDAYLTAARRVLDSSTPATALRDSELLLKSQTGHLNATVSMFRTKADSIGVAEEHLKQMLATVLALLLLLLLCGWLIFHLYRRELPPLHRRLDEHAAIIEKQRKLAHFGELAAGLAHEIRNPLTAINARLFTLQRSLPPDTRAHEDTRVIRNEVNRLDRVVGNFLKLARPAEPQFIPLAAEPLFRELIDLLAPGLLAKKITLTLGPTVPDSFQGDPIQLKQILINLIKNAAESISQDGTITLRALTGTEPIKDVSTQVVILEVEDNGPGIPREVQDRLFEPFYSTKTAGTGLGLSISWQIADKHGGMLTFQNKRPHGSLFRLMLPRRTGD